MHIFIQIQMNSIFAGGILRIMPKTKDEQALPPVDPLKNLMELIYVIARDILKAFPFLVGGLTLILFLIIALLMFLFQGSIIEP